MQLFILYKILIQKKILNKYFIYMDILIFYLESIIERLLRYIEKNINNN